jgi:hypothetical protein
MKPIAITLFCLALSLAASSAQAANELILRYADGHVEHVPMQRVRGSAPATRDTVNRTVDMNATAYITGTDASGTEVEVDVLQAGTQIWLGCEFTQLAPPAFPLIQSLGEVLTLTTTVTGVATTEYVFENVIDRHMAGLVSIAIGYIIPADTPPGTLTLNTVLEITNLTLTDNVSDVSYPVE